MSSRFFTAAVLAVTLLAGRAASGQAPQAASPGAAKDHVAALKQALHDGQVKIRQYEWIETTIISLKGEEKARKQNRCYYGTDGNVQKVPIESGGAPAQADQGGGGRGRRGARMKEKIVENKKEDIQEYMQRAAKLVHSYVPPNPATIQAAKDAGRVTMTPQPGGPMHITVAQYQLPGDALNIDLDPAANRLLGLGVKSYLDEPDDAVTLVVRMATLPDGALYAAQTTLDATAKNITVVIQNSGHRPATR